MATPDLLRFNGITLLPKPPYNDTDKVTTDYTANTVNKNGRVIKEFYVKFEFNVTSNDSVLHHHRQIMTTILNAHSGAVQLFDKHEKMITQEKINNIKSVTDQQGMFITYSKSRMTTRRTRHTIIQKIRTTISLSDIKNTEMVMHQMKTKNIYLRMHYFEPTAWDINNSIGWLRDIHPTLMSHEAVRTTIEVIYAAHGKNTKIPQYNLAYFTPSSTDKNNKSMRMKAVEIQVERNHRWVLDKLLKKAFMLNPIYVPWRMKYTDLNQYQMNLRAQHKYLTNTWPNERPTEWTNDQTSKRTNKQTNQKANEPTDKPRNK